MEKDIWRRSVSRSAWKHVRSRDVRLVNLWKRPGRKGMVGSHILKDDQQRLVMERNFLETTERDSKLRWLRNLMTCSQQSSGKYKYSSAVVFIFFDKAFIVFSSTNQFYCEFEIGYVWWLYSNTLIPFGIGIYKRENT